MNPDTHLNSKTKRLKIDVKIGEFMEINCPQYDQATPSQDTSLFYLYDLHDKQSFELCDIKGKQIILSCDSPYRSNKLTFKFQRMSPYPLGFTFQDGKSYYYIAIPKGEDDCNNAMRLIVNVEKKKGHEVVVPQLSSVVYKDDRPSEISTKPTTIMTTTTRTTTTTTVTPRKQIDLRSTTEGGNSSSKATYAILVTILLAIIACWTNW